MRKEERLTPKIKRMTSPLGATMVVDGREVDYFCGTSYYALHGDRRIIEAACHAIQEYGMGPATLMTSPPLAEVETLAARFFDTEAAQYIISGYLTDMTLVQALRDDYDVAFVDSASHYSVFDGVSSTQKRVVIFCHLNAGDLERKLQEELRRGEVPLVITDGIFPVTGTVAPLADYVAVLDRYEKALLCVDDSHAVGVIGDRGQGSLEYCEVQGPRRYLAGTLSKAFGGLGGVIPADGETKEKIRRNVRIPIGASPPSSGAAAAAAMGLKIVASNPRMRRQLWENVARMRKGLRELGVDTGYSPVPIVSVSDMGKVDLEVVQQRLEEKGMLVAYVAPSGYSDAPNCQSLRIAIFSTHTDEQIDRLIDALADLL